MDTDGQVINTMADHQARVLHLIATNFVGGPEKQILHHAQELQELGWQIWIGSFRDQVQRAEILEQAEARALPTCEIKRGRFDIRSAWELADFLKQNKIQLLCTHGYKATIVGSVAKRLAGIPQIAFCRGWTAETLRVRIYEALERRFLGLSDRIVCVSQAQAEKLGNDSQQIHVVHNAVLSTEICAADRASLKQQLGFSATVPLVGCVGRLSVEKGQRHLLNAAAELSKKVPAVQIVLLGEGRERGALEAQMDQLGLRGIVHLPGFQKNVAIWMQAFDVLANCSDTEGIPNAILEAMAIGTPVVATAVGGVPALIRDGETGLLTPPADAPALANALRRVLQDPALATQLGHNGRRWVKDKFSAVEQRKQLIAIYRDVLNQIQTPATIAETETSSTKQQWPFISVVIPVRNEAANVAGVLGALLSQEYPRDRFEVLVTDGNSTDGTRKVVESWAGEHANIRLLENPAQLSSAGRNVGVRNSRGELMVFIDGHCRIPSKNLLAETARLFAATAADCLCRPQPLEANGDSVFQQAVAHARASALGHGRDSTIYSTTLEGFVNPTSSGASYRRQVFEQIGMYDETLDACEDVEFNYRVWRKGLRSCISPRLAVYYHARKTLPGLWKQMMRYGRGRYRFIRRHPDAISIAQLLPSAFVLWLALGTISSFWSPMLRMPMLITVGLYGAAVVASSAWLAFSQGWRNLFLAPIIYPVIHIGLGTGMLAEYSDAARQWLRFAQPPMVPPKAEAPVSHNSSE